MKEEKRLIYSGMITPDNTLLHSRHVHDYVTHEDKNGKHYMLDGGNEYIRSSVNGDESFISIYSDEPHGILRLWYFRLGYGKPGTPDYGKKLKTTFLALMSDNHLTSAIDYLKNKGIKGFHLDTLLNEVNFRAKNKIKINE